MMKRCHRNVVKESDWKAKEKFASSHATNVYGRVKLQLN
jgi:hypothetical protein